MKTRAFTLIELMVVIAIIAIISAIAIPHLMAKRNETVGTTVNQPIKIRVGESNYYARKFDLDGHSYFMIHHNNAHGFTAVHAPECPKCHPAPIKDMKVEEQ